MAVSTNYLALPRSKSSTGNNMETDFLFLDSSSDEVELLLSLTDRSALLIAGCTTFSSVFTLFKIIDGLPSFAICNGEMAPISGKIGQLNLKYKREVLNLGTYMYFLLTQLGAGCDMVFAIR